jgi:hypothetical protein
MPLCIVIPARNEAARIGAGLAVLAAGLATTFAFDLAAVLVALAVGFALFATTLTDLGAGFATFLELAFTTGLAVLATGFEVVFETGLAAGFLAAGLATGFAAGFFTTGLGAGV